MVAGEQRWGRLHHALQAQRHATAGGSLYLASVMGLFGANACAYVAQYTDCWVTTHVYWCLVGKHSIEPYPVHVTI